MEGLSDAELTARARSGQLGLGVQAGQLAQDRGLPPARVMCAQMIGVLITYAIESKDTLTELTAEQIVKIVEGKTWKS